MVLVVIGGLALPHDEDDLQPLGAQRPERLAIDCVETMERAPKVTQLLVVDGQERLVGALHLHDLFRARVI